MDVKSVKDIDIANMGKKRDYVVIVEGNIYANITELNGIVKNVADLKSANMTE